MFLWMIETENTFLIKMSYPEVWEIRHTEAAVCKRSKK